MKKIVSLLFTLLLTTHTAFAFPNEPEGFRELKWGDSIQTLHNLYSKISFEKSREHQSNSLNNIKFDIYKVELKNRILSSLKLDKDAEYIFHNNQFVGINLNSTLKPSSDFKNIESNFIKNLIALYGSPSNTKTYCTAAVGTTPNKNNVKYITSYTWDSDSRVQKEPLSRIHVDTIVCKHTKVNTINIIIFKNELWENYLQSKVSTINNKQEIERQGW